MSGSKTDSVTECVQLSGHSICTLKRDKPKKGLGSATILDAAGNDLATTKWSEQMRSGVDLKCVLWSNPYAPDGAPESLTSPTLALGRAGGRGTVKYVLRLGETTLATFDRVPVAGETMSIRLEVGVDACLVSAIAVAAAYAVRDLYVAVWSREAHGEMRVESYMEQLLHEAQRSPMSASS